MNILAIDTTSEQFVAVAIKGGESFSRTLKAIGGHSKMIIPAIDETLKALGLEVCDLDAVAAVVGPGSFTGIRIGVAAMNAFAFANNLKRISVTSFELVAYSRERVRAAVDAGHNNLYVADCVDGEVRSTCFVENAKDFEGLEFSTVLDRAETLKEVVLKKAAKGKFSSSLVPYYMRKSQAEREKDGD